MEQPENPVEFVNIRVTGIGPVPKIGAPPVPAGGSLETALVKRDMTVFRVDEHLQQFDTAFYRRDALPLDETMPGPAIVLQTDSTTVIPPACSFIASGAGTLVINVGLTS